MKNLRYGGSNSREIYDPHTGETVAKLCPPIHPGINPDEIGPLMAKAPEMAEAIRDLIESAAGYPGDITLAVVSMETVRRLAVLARDTNPPKGRKEKEDEKNRI